MSVSTSGMCCPNIGPPHAGCPVVRQSRIGKNASDSELLSEANALRTSGAEVVYLLTSPVNFIKLATNAQAQAYSPIYMGPGITNGLNVVAEAGCPAIGSAKFLSPFPQLDVIDNLDPDYQKSYQKYNGGKGDDIGLAEWGLSKVIGSMLQASGKDVSGVIEALNAIAQSLSAQRFGP